MMLHTLKVAVGDHMPFCSFFLCGKLGGKYRWTSIVYLSAVHILVLSNNTIL